MRDIAITATQTTITSIKNSSLEIGRDNDNTIDFSTNVHTIIFNTNGSTTAGLIVVVTWGLVSIICLIIMMMVIH